MPAAHRQTLPILLLVGAAAAAGAVDSDLEQRYRSVTEWQGTLVVTETAAVAHDCDGWMTQFSRRLDNASVSHFRLVQAAGSGTDGVFRWEGAGSVDARNDLQLVNTNKAGVGQSVSEHSAGSLGLTGVALTLDLRAGRMSFHNGATSGTLPRVTTGEYVESELDPSTSQHVLVALPADRSDTENRWAKARFDPEVAWAPQPPQSLSFSDDRRVDELSSWAGTLCESQSGDQRLVTIRSSLSLVPVIQTLELVVRLDGTQLDGRKTAYAEWLPEGVGTPFEDPKPGSRLSVDARLQYRDGAPADDVEVERFRFELRGASREPAVAMNWPALALPGDHSGPIPPDPDPDLRFLPAHGPIDARDDLQRQTVEPGEDTDGAPLGSTTVESFDFGGWAELVVVAELEDGTEVTGHLQGEPDTWQITLPKRTAGSRIADVWRERNQARGGDAEDTERTEVGEPGCNGDGLTLYEEYRGFMVNGRHRRTSPQKKDLFLYSRCGAVANAGIALFERLTGIVVHRDLLEDERNYDMPEETRFGIRANRYTGINGYFDQGPHRVTQHRLELVSCGIPRHHGGASATVEIGAANVHNRPYMVEAITVEAPGQEFWQKQYGVRSVDQLRQFDVALAHEMLHAVGVDHHGEYDWGMKIEARPPGDPLNPTRDWAWLEQVTATRYEARFLVDEASGRDVSKPWARRTHQRSEAMQAAIEDEPALSFRTNNGTDLLVQDFHVGRPNGEHSGNEQCVMRYWLADAYPKRGSKDTYYLVPDGTEPVGAQLCADQAGHSINLASRQPQPRYFDAHPTRGRCRHWVCMNDAVAPKPSKVPYTPP